MRFAFVVQSDQRLPQEKPRTDLVSAPETAAHQGRRFRFRYLVTQLYAYFANNASKKITMGSP